jgi:hypothetical protein
MHFFMTPFSLIFHLLTNAGCGGTLTLFNVLIENSNWKCNGKFTASSNLALDG